mmetsp:Transcript_118920/g.308696  ORF Transcript_118920/g.308696 Transcript_118920/m.308696 type:complete len:252 (+) Transcript_118920:1-756(+)
MREAAMFSLCATSAAMIFLASGTSSWACLSLGASPLPISLSARSSCSTDFLTLKCNGLTFRDFLNSDFVITTAGVPFISNISSFASSPMLAAHDFNNTELILTTSGGMAANWMPSFLPSSGAATTRQRNDDFLFPAGVLVDTLNCKGSSCCNSVWGTTATRSIASFSSWWHEDVSMGCCGCFAKFARTRLPRCAAWILTAARSSRALCSFLHTMSRVFFPRCMAWMRVAATSRFCLFLNKSDRATLPRWTV